MSWEPAECRTNAAGSLFALVPDVERRRVKRSGCDRDASPPRETPFAVFLRHPAQPTMCTILTPSVSTVTLSRRRNYVRLPQSTRCVPRLALAVTTPRPCNRRHQCVYRAFSAMPPPPSERGHRAFRLKPLSGPPAEKGKRT